MKFLIQHNLMSDDQLQAVKDTLTRNNLPHSFIGLIPFSRDITSEEEIVGTDYIPYGSTLLTTLASDLGWKGCFFNPETFSISSSISNRDDMLNNDMVFPIEVVISFMRKQEPDSLWFVRPDLDLKQFSGQVISAKECADWLTDAMECQMSGTYQMPKGTMIVVSYPKNIQAEWRWFVVNRKVVSGAMYRCRNQLVKYPETGEKIIAEAQTYADKWLPADCCVMDLALVDGKLKVIEFNTINSSGFYGHDLDPIFNRLWEYCNG